MHLERVAIAGLAGLLLAHGATAQPAAREQPVRIRTFGGLLGSFEGYIEYPGGPWDPLRGDNRAVASGGLIGAAHWLRDHPAPDALLLVTGNNMPSEPAADRTTEVLPPLSPAHPLWTRLAALTPAAVALGPEDFIRGLADGAGAFTAFLRDASASGIPFVASNAIVREQGAGLNTIPTCRPAWTSSRRRPMPGCG